MFEIGSTLRQSRTRQGLELRDAERETRIRTKYLAPLEEERSDQLPAEAYAKAFLRTYADFLGLDSELFVAELHSHLVASRPPPPPPPKWRLVLPSLDLRAAAAVRCRSGRRGRGRALLALRRRAGGAKSPGRVSLAARCDADRGSTHEAQAEGKPNARPPRDDCRTWRLLALCSSRLEGRGRPVRGNLRGDSLRFARKRLWVRMGAPWNLAATLNGKTVQGLPDDTGNVLFTRAGVKAVEPSGTAVDGDVAYCVATGLLEANLLAVSAVAADVAADAIRDGVRHASGAPGCPAAGDRNHGRP